MKVRRFAAVLAPRPTVIKDSNALSRTPSRDLYDLIHSLTSAGKRYVRRTALVSGRQTAWLRLFDIIDRQQAFNEEDLRRTLSGDPMLGNLSVAKRYVYEAVLRALQGYGTGRDFDSEMGK